MNSLKGLLCPDLYCCYSDNLSKAFFGVKSSFERRENVSVPFSHENIFALAAPLVK